MSNQPKKIYDGTTDGWSRLVEAIIVQAWEDYAEARCRMTKARKYDRYLSAFQDALEIEKFFSSEWFIMLTGTTGAVLFDHIHKDYRYALSDEKE